MSMWREYVPVGVRKARAKSEMEKLKKKGQKIEPVEIEGRSITRNFWGNKWCDHLESFADYENRLPRGRTYVRNGSVCHLKIEKGVCCAIVSGSELYKISINIQSLDDKKWDGLKKNCSGKVGSLLELLQGKISHQVMEIVADQVNGLFPKEHEMKFSCSCPDWAGMCKHVAAVLYGIGSRLDHQPELLFLLRGVNPSELISTQLMINQSAEPDQLKSEELSDIFGIDLEVEAPPKLSSKESSVLKTKPEKIKKTQAKKDKKLTSKMSLDLENLSGERLQEFRTKKGYTVNAFAQALGVTTASVYRWEQSRDILKLQFRPKNALKELLRS